MPGLQALAGMMASRVRRWQTPMAASTGSDLINQWDMPKTEEHRPAILKTEDSDWQEMDPTPGKSF